MKHSFTTTIIIYIYHYMYHQEYFVGSTSMVETPSENFGTWSPSDTRPGKRSHDYGKSPFLMGQSSISMVIFKIYAILLEGRRFFTDNPEENRRQIHRKIHRKR